MLGWEFPPRTTGGLGTACRGIVRGLTGRGVQVLLVLPRVRGDEDAGTARLTDGRDYADGDEAGVPAVPGAGLHLVPLDSPLRPYEGRVAYAARRAAARNAEEGEDPYGADLEGEVERFALAVCRVARREPFDVIHAHDWMTYPAGLLARRLTGRPLLCHVHSTERDRRGEASDPVLAAIERQGLEGADRVVCVSRRTVETVVAEYGIERARCRVVHNGVELDDTPRAPRAAGDATPPTVLFLGRLTAQKGPLPFLDAAALVLRERPDVRFVMAGDGDLRAELMKRAVRLRIADRVRFPGFLGAEEVRRQYDAADVYVMPSVSEPFGIASLEALSRDVPVVVSRQSGVTEVLDSRLVADFWDVRELAGKILAVLRYPALRRQLIEGGRAERERWGWERTADSLLDVYGELSA